jgi:hypothetical protein
VAHPQKPQKHQRLRGHNPCTRPACLLSLLKVSTLGKFPKTILTRIPPTDMTSSVRFAWLIQQSEGSTNGNCSISGLDCGEPGADRPVCQRDQRRSGKRKSPKRYPRWPLDRSISSSKNAASRGVGAVKDYCMDLTYTAIGGRAVARGRSTSP